MKSKILVSLFIVDPNIGCDFLEDPSNYTEFNNLEVRVYQYTYRDPDDEDDRGYFLGLYEYEGDIIPVDTIVGNLEDYGTINALIWCSDNVLNNDIEEIEDDNYRCFDFKNESCGFYQDPAYSFEEYYAGNKYKAKTYEEFWVKDNPTYISTKYKLEDEEIYYEEFVFEEIKYIKGDR